MKKLNLKTWNDIKDFLGDSYFKSGKGKALFSWYAMSNLIIDTTECDVIIPWTTGSSFLLKIILIAVYYISLSSVYMDIKLPQISHHA